MTTPESLLQSLQNRTKEHEALRLLWTSVLPKYSVPSPSQFNIWLNRYPFDFVVKGIEKTGDKYQKVLSQENREMDQDFMIRYASGVMVQKSQQAREQKAGPCVSKVGNFIYHSQPNNEGVCPRCGEAVSRG